MHQLALPLRLPAAGGFESFVADGNTEPLAAMRQWSEQRGERFLFLHGGPGTGKSHLLQAACRSVAARGRAAVYLPLDDRRLDPAVLENLERSDAVAVDALEAIAGDGPWELAVFALYNRLQEAGTRLLVAARVPPAQVGVRLPDLVSRLEAGARYRLSPLDEHGCARLIGTAAEQRGLRLDRDAVGYILRRVPRDPERLLSLIDELDRSTLQRQRAPTVRFIGELLMGRTPRP